MRLLHRRSSRPLLGQQLLGGPHDPQPDGLPGQIALLKHGVRLPGSFGRRVLAVLADEDVGGAVDV